MYYLKILANLLDLRLNCPLNFFHALGNKFDFVLIFGTSTRDLFLQQTGCVHSGNSLATHEPVSPCSDTGYNTFT